MPSIHITTKTALDRADRAELAEIVTDAITGVAGVLPEKVSGFFFVNPGAPSTIVVYAVSTGTPDAWANALRARFGSRFTIHIEFFQADDTFKAGQLRRPTGA
jgi:hypothetical protein